MHKNLTPVIAGEEAESLVGVIPLDFASGHERDLTRRGTIGCPQGTSHKAIGTAAVMADPDLSETARDDTIAGRQRHRATLTHCGTAGSDVAPAAAAGATSSTASHVGWCWDGIACEARNKRVLPTAAPRSINTQVSDTRVRSRAIMVWLVWPV